MEPVVIEPEAVIQRVVDAIPVGARPHLVIIGSLAAAYWLQRGDASFSVRTKDVDAVLSPRAAAVGVGRSVVESLRGSGWSLIPSGPFAAPGNAITPDHELPAFRAYPPGRRDWFIELLTEPEAAQQGRRWMRLAVGRDHFGLPSFPCTGIAIFEATLIGLGVRVARPEMMALANLLEHPTIRPDVIEGTTTKRSNKDLGRVLAIATLTETDRLETWSDAWLAALRDRFAAGWRELARRAGDGLRALLASPADLQQAVENCNNGLLASRPTDAEKLKAIGDRVLVFAIDDLQRQADSIVAPT